MVGRLLPGDLDLHGEWCEAPALPEGPKAPVDGVVGCGEQLGLD